MRKTFNFLVCGLFVLIAAVLNVILFLTIPEGRSQENAFWLIWAFTFPVNLIIGIVSLLVANKKAVDSVVRVPMAITIVIAAYAVYVLCGFCFFFYAKAIQMATAIIVEVVITAIYVAVLVFTFFGFKYIERNQKHTKQKVAFIRLLKADVESCLAFANEETAVYIKRLADKVRFSDPMSDDALKDCEREISALVMGLRVRMREGNNATVEQDVKQIESLLDYRNERCKILK